MKFSFTANFHYCKSVFWECSCITQSLNICKREATKNDVWNAYTYFLWDELVILLTDKQIYSEHHNMSKITVSLQKKKKKAKHMLGLLWSTNSRLRVTVRQHPNTVLRDDPHLPARLLSRNWRVTRRRQLRNWCPVADDVPGKTDYMTLWKTSSLWR